MADYDDTLDRIEFRLKKAFQAHERARTRGDHYENVFRVHGALRQALDLHLGEQAKLLTFPQKFEQVLPDVFSSCPVAAFNNRRNELAHPKQPPDDLYVYKTATGLVDLAEMAWRGLFGHDAPSVRHPDFHPATAPAAGTVVLPAPPPATAPPPAYRPVRPVQVMAEAPVLAPTAAPPPASVSKWRLPALAALVVIVLIMGAFLLGRQNPPVDPTRISVGGQALVSVPAGKVVLLRTAPGISQQQTTPYKNGAVLDVTGGPVTYEGLTWWKVRGPEGEGWTAAVYLTPMGG